MAWLNYDVTDGLSVNKLYTLFKKHFENGYNFTGEMHDFWECMYVLNGSMRVSADENVCTLTAGEMIVLKPFQLHKFSVDDENGVTLFIFSFSMTGELCKKMDGRAYQLDNSQIEIIDKFIEYVDLELSGNSNVEHTKFYWNILTYFENNDIFLQTVANNICRIMLMLLSGARSLSKIKTHETELFNRALNIMNDNIMSDISVTMLAKSLDISVSSLKRLFDKYAGISVHKYFLTLKIKKATFMLKSGTPVNEVADKLNFSSQGYFSAAYKRETGKNPSQI